MHSKTSKQANDIILKENDTVSRDKKQMAELFNEHFAYIADGVGEITDHYYGEGFYDHPSIKVIQANNGKRRRRLSQPSTDKCHANRREVV